MYGSVLRDLFPRLNTWRLDVSGGITAFTAMIFSFMLLAFGMGVDFMRHETMRAELQNAVDRGVLAAAAMDQTIDAEVTVRGYIQSTNFVENGYGLSVTPSVTPEGLNAITAVANYDMDTYFLKLVGIDSIPIVADGAAVEGIDSVELSLVLDVSTSMSYETTGGTTDSRLTVMKDAAKQFVDVILGNSPNGTVTVNLVPFAGQVNPGNVVFNHLRSAKVQNYSRCIEFLDSDFLVTTLPAYRSRAQTQYFQFSIPWNQKNGVTYSEIGWGWCPHKSEEKVIYHSSNATKLKNAITNLNTHEATGTQIGMKWGVALLDPTSNVLTTKLINKNQVDSQFADLPRAYSDTTNKKFIVIMSDGNTTQQLRLKPEKYDTDAEEDFYAGNLSTCQGCDFQYNTTPTSTARTQFLSQCTQAKSAGVIIFTIGFDISTGSAAHTDMSACASSPSHFYDVDGLQLNNAFSAIASTIQKLKLIN